MPADLNFRREIEESLGAFLSIPLGEASTAFWRTLGYASQRTLPLLSKADFRQQFDRKDKLNEATAFWNDWQEVKFLFQLNDDDIRAEVQLISGPFCCLIC